MQMKNQQMLLLVTFYITFFFFLSVPPSPPVCRIEGEAAYFHNITLTCKSEEGSPKPVTEWKTYSTENTPRPFPPKTIESMHFISSLTLQYVSLVRQSFFPYSYWHYLAYFLSSLCRGWCSISLQHFKRNIWVLHLHINK